MAFTHLHVHTEFSLLDGFCKIKELPGVVKSMGQTACAITDTVLCTASSTSIGLARRRA